MIVLEGDQPLGDAAHKYLRRAWSTSSKADKQHVEHIQDFWGDPLTASGAQSADGKAAYVQVYLAGNQGEALANESVQAVRDDRRHVDAATGRQGLRHRPRRRSSSDQHHAGDQQHAADQALITIARDLHHAAARLPVHRHGAAGLGDDVAIELSAARGIVAALGYYNLIGLSTFAVNLLTTLAIAAVHRLRDLPDRPIPRSAGNAARIAKPPSTRCITAPPT